ncbi:MAG: CoA-acylating methylmalonate-semialdehyde dehydrogenase [Proteobacteria bacterium]|nr:CoA-acylating methylmalonate-semialdehyde dehydrogenase [Pseudomonadota bacterium]
MTTIVHHFINGQGVAGKNNHLSPLYNPATGAVAGQVAFASTTEIEEAIKSAKNAFRAWSLTPSIKRARVLFKFKELLEQNIEKLAELVTKEHGKLLEDAKGSILRGIELVEFMCGIPNLLKGSYSENVGTDVDSYTVRQPLGVCVGITPFNFPVMVPIWLMIPAIACGNTFILKPSEKDPSAPLFLAELLHQAGLPAGVLNVIHGDKTAVDLLIKHPDVVAVNAIGSTPVAEYIYKTAVMHGKRAQTFGGAKNHGVVMPDAEIDRVVEAVLGAAYGSAGERCMALPVVVAVGDKVADALVKPLKKRVEALKIGPGHMSGMDMGPLVTREHLERVKSYVDLGVKEGANLIVDGRGLKVSGYENGFFMGGCLFDHVTSEMRIYREEVFGPVLCVVRVKDFESALRLVNEHEYGNGTAIFTQDGNIARRFTHEVQVGMVGVNVPIPVPVAYHSFGGWKHSVFGDVGLHAEQGVQFYTKLKTVTERWFAGEKSEAHYFMPS